MSRIDHDGTFSPVCPHCGHEHQDAWEWKGDEGEQDCWSCGRCFSYHRMISVEYSTQRRDKTLARELAFARRIFATCAGDPDESAYHGQRVARLEAERARLIARGEWAVDDAGGAP